MKARIINKDGKAWDFESVRKALSHIKKDCRDNYTIIEEDGEKIRVYDDTEFNDYVSV